MNLFARNTPYSFIHSVICLTTGPKPHLKRFPHIVGSRASSFKWEYPLLSLRSSSSFLHLPRLLVTSLSPFIFPSITCFRRQFLPKMWPIQLAFRFLISCRIFLCSLTLSNTCSRIGTGKAIHIEDSTGLEGSRWLRPPDFQTIGTWRWQGSQPNAPAAFTP